MLTETKSELESALYNLFANINTMGAEEETVDVIVSQIRRQHRTLQQGFFRVMAKVIQAHGDTKEMYTDPRNESSVKWAREISKVDAYMPFI